MEEDPVKERSWGAGNETRGQAGYSRRNILKGSAALLVGGMAGRVGSAIAAPDPSYAPAPPLPWKWTKLDPMEAGTRAYQTYLKQKG
jgi:hypothetical protein